MSYMVLSRMNESAQAIFLKYALSYTYNKNNDQHLFFIIFKEYIVGPIKVVYYMWTKLRGEYKETTILFCRNKLNKIRVVENKAVIRQITRSKLQYLLKTRCFTQWQLNIEQYK